MTLLKQSPTYNITVTQVQVGTTLIDVEFTALFDSGTSFTYLVDLTYTRLTESFHSQVQDRRRPSDSRIPFEYCYDMSPEANTSLIPSMSLRVFGSASHQHNREPTPANASQARFKIVWLRDRFFPPSCV